MAETSGAVDLVEALTREAPARRRFTVDEYYRMADAGILREDERVELLDGEIVLMAAIRSRHARCVEFLAEWFIIRLVGQVIVRIQNPVRLDDGSEPEPDIALLRMRADRYGDVHPGPPDVLLLIEVADSSLGYDRDTKLPRYAKAGIPELWLVDLNGERVLMHRKPNGTRYEQVEAIERGEMLTVDGFPHISLPVNDLLG
ncbi:MAG: Uma2 family endonuclease [Dehalococcoidia bacterium]